MIAQRDRLRRALEGALGVPFTRGNTVTPLRNGAEIFPAMLDAIEEARWSVDFETFVYWTGDIARRFAHALAAAARRGVRVRVLLDGVGSIPMPRDVQAVLDESPALCRTFRPPNPLRFWEVDHRSHRKILVCDDRVGFTGGVGIAEEWEGDARNPDEWRETHFRVRGPVVRLLRAAFVEHWLATSTTDDPDAARSVPSPPREEGPRCLNSLADGGPGPAEVQLVRSTAGVGWNDARSLLRALISAAERRLRIATAYFVPGADLVTLLCEAAERGVAVLIMNPGPHVDHRISQLAGERVYADLLEAGVRIFRYQRTMLHVKAVTVDGVLSCVGSVNLNRRSLLKDDEVALNVLDPSLTAALDTDFDADLKECEEVSEARDWSDRSLVQRTGEWFARLFQNEL